MEALLAGQDVLAILPTGFGKSLIYQVICMAKLSSNANASVLVFSPLNSIVEEQVNERKINTFDSCGVTASHNKRRRKKLKY